MLSARFSTVTKSIYVSIENSCTIFLVAPKKAARPGKAAWLAGFPATLLDPTGGGLGDTGRDL